LPETRLPADAQEATAPGGLTRRALMSAGAVGGAGAAVLATAGPAAAVTTPAAKPASKRLSPARRRRALQRLQTTKPQAAQLPDARKLLAGAGRDRLPGALPAVAHRAPRERLT
jgi:hypothetical protein